MQAILPNKRSIRGLFCSEVRSRAHFHLGFPIWCLEGSKSRAFIGGRRINLHCTGTGGPTVILMAGLFSWSVVWYKTQPVIAQKTRVCAFDRAGYGFSDPGPRPGLPALQAGTSGAVIVQYACVRPGHARNCAKIFIDGAYLAVGHVLVHGPRHDLQ